MIYKFDVKEVGEITDGSHTFNELYYHRMILFSVICNTYKEYSWKSWKHEDGTMYKDYFIVGTHTPKGDYSYHYHKDHWDKFNIKELSHAPKFDGHKPSDIDRLISLLYIPCKCSEDKSKFLKMKNLVACFKSAKENNANFVGVKIQMLDCNKSEIIINPKENFDAKLSYYKIAYDDYLQLKSIPDKIRITGFTFGNTFEDIQKDLLEG